mmetsp:Transcript_6476/g.18846  ORF Transcript_6476/g.18846 Transcript_6476/m.18846 type:complete len:284 (+) Transcript_6476:450-1301(+)
MTINPYAPMPCLRTSSSASSPSSATSYAMLLRLKTRTFKVKRSILSSSTWRQRRTGGASAFASASWSALASWASTGAAPARLTGPLCWTVAGSATSNGRTGADAGEGTGPGVLSPTVVVGVGSTSRRPDSAACDARLSCSSTCFSKKRRSSSCETLHAALLSRHTLVAALALAPLLRWSAGALRRSAKRTPLLVALLLRPNGTTSPLLLRFPSATPGRVLRRVAEVVTLLARMKLESSLSSRSAPAGCAERRSTKPMPLLRPPPLLRRVVTTPLRFRTPAPLL